MLIKDQFGIIQMSPIPQTIFLVGTFFAVSYSKPALARIHLSEFLLQRQLPLGCKQVVKFSLVVICIDRWRSCVDTTRI